jgi:hypothetical protein
MGQQRRRLSRVPSLNSTLTWLLPDLVSQETVVAQFYDLLHNLPCEHGEDLDHLLSTGEDSTTTKSKLPNFSSYWSFGKRWSSCWDWPGAETKPVAQMCNAGCLGWFTRHKLRKSDHYLSAAINVAARLPGSLVPTRPNHRIVRRAGAIRSSISSSTALYRSAPCCGILVK